MKLLALVILLTVTSKAQNNIFQVLRNNDPSSLQNLLESGAGVNTHNEHGITPLMYAAGFASTESMRLLLDRGARVNAVSNSGATALMWATGDETKVRLLMERGADPNLARKNGSNALTIAATKEKAGVVRLLIRRGADARGSADALLRTAYRQQSSEVRQVLQEHGIKLANLSQLGPLPLQLNSGNSAVLRELLNAGADPNELGFLGGVRVPVLGFAAYGGSAEAIQTLLDQGADPRRPDTHKRTPLMLAAASPRATAAVVRLLIQHGANVTENDATGRSALDWALTRGDTEVSRALRKAGGREHQQRTTRSVVKQPRTARHAVMIALQQLLPASVASFEHWKCNTCHNQMLPAIAAKLASEHGVAVRERAGGPEGFKAIEEDLMLGRGTIVPFEMFAVAERAIPSNSSTDAAVHFLTEKQRVDGSWRFADPRPPLAPGPMTNTAYVIRALSQYVPPGMRKEVDLRIAKAIAYIRSADPVDIQDEAFRLAAFVWSHSSKAEIERQVKRVSKLQRSDGGWGQFPGIESDAYGTGVALYSLKLSGLPVNNKVYREGIKYLLRTQLEDGTWLVRSRAIGFQPYFETGFPHGVDQYISAAATSWAVIALAYTL